MVKLEMIFFKSGYFCAPKMLDGKVLLKNWNAKSQSFRIGCFKATAKNKILFDLRTQCISLIKWRKKTGLATIVQIALIYYVDLYSLFNNPEKDCEHMAVLLKFRLIN